MTVGVAVFIALAVAAVAGVLALDWMGARRQRRRLSSGEGRRGAHPSAGASGSSPGNAGYGSISTGGNQGRMSGPMS